MKIYIAVINTEDCEKYYFTFSEEPLERKIKKIFFDTHGENYKKTDWNECIGWEVIETELIK